MFKFDKRRVTLITIFLILALVTRNASARSGCASFGHSCFGAMGKRANTEYPDLNEETLKNIIPLNSELAGKNMQDLHDEAFAILLTDDDKRQINKLIKSWLINNVKGERLQE